MKKTMVVLIAFLALGSVADASAVGCGQMAGRVARAVEALSNRTSESRITIQGAERVRSVRDDNRALETYRVTLVASEDLAAIYEVDLSGSKCLVRAVRYVTGD